MIHSEKMDRLKDGGDSSYWDVFKLGHSFHLEALMSPLEYESENHFIEPFLELNKLGLG